MKKITKLISIGSESLEEPIDEFDFSKIVNNENFIEELEGFYGLKNGFYAFESALHIFPISDREDVLTFQKWNSESLWRNCYQGVEKNIYFFAEDIFGMQFCFKENEIFMFDGETFKFDLIATSLEEWAQKILSDYNLYTGYTLAHDWQKINGTLKSNKRLGPVVPFIGGGKFEVDNLREVDSVELMRFRASLYNQLKNVPDGTKVKLVVKKSEK